VPFPSAAMASTKKPVCYYAADQCLMHFRTDQGVKIQKLFETLAPLLVDGNIVFSQKGIELKSLANNLYASFELKAENLDEYSCKDRFQCGVNFPILFKYFKTVTQNDAVALQLTREGFDSKKPVMFVHIITSTMTYSYRYSLLAIDEVGFEVPEQRFDTVVRISSVAFLRALRSCEQVGDAVQIMSKATNAGSKSRVAVYIVCEGMQSDLQVTISPTDEEPTTGDAQDVFNTSDKRERYYLKLLNYIAKATSLSNTVQLFLAPAYALLIRYRVGKLGHVTFGVPPKKVDSSFTVGDIDGSTDCSVTTASKRRLPYSTDSCLLSEVLVRKRPRKTAAPTTTTPLAITTTSAEVEGERDDDEDEEEEEVVESDEGEDGEE
jgi:proliferating cell nuclear antigen PCNA